MSQIRKALIALLFIPAIAFSQETSPQETFPELREDKSLQEQIAKSFNLYDTEFGKEIARRGEGLNCTFDLNLMGQFIQSQRGLSLRLDEGERDRARIFYADTAWASLSEYSNVAPWIADIKTRISKETSYKLSLKSRGEQTEETTQLTEISEQERKEAIKDKQTTTVEYDYKMPGKFDLGLNPTINNFSPGIEAYAKYEREGHKAKLTSKLSQTPSLDLSLTRVLNPNAYLGFNTGVAGFGESDYSATMFLTHETHTPGKRITISCGVDSVEDLFVRVNFVMGF